MTMPDAPATDPDDRVLDQLLALYVAGSDLVETGMGGGQGSAGPKALGALFFDIWTTLLPRRLIFRAKPDGILSLDVADRHILQVVAASGPWIAGLAEPIDKIKGVRLADPDIPVLHTLLSRFAASGGLSVLQQQISARPPDGAGISVHVLRQYQPPAIQAVDTLIQRFVSSLGDTATAVLYVDHADHAVTRGDTAALERLRATLDPGDAAGPDNADQMMIVSSGQSAAASLLPEAILIANADQGQILCSFDARHTLAMAGLWIRAKRHAQ